MDAAIARRYFASGHHLNTRASSRHAEDGEFHSCQIAEQIVESKSGSADECDQVYILDLWICPRESGAIRHTYEDMLLKKSMPLFERSL